MPHLCLLSMAGVVGILTSVTCLSLQFKHLLSCMLSLEAITLSLFIFILAESTMSNSETYVMLVYITLAACEASLGLAILVSLIRTHGNDYVSNYSSQKC